MEEEDRNQAETAELKLLLGWLGLVFQPGAGHIMTENKSVRKDKRWHTGSWQVPSFPVSSVGWGRAGNVGLTECTAERRCLWVSQVCIISK